MCAINENNAGVGLEFNLFFSFWHQMQCAMISVRQRHKLSLTGLEMLLTFLFMFDKNAKITCIVLFMPPLCATT